MVLACRQRNPVVCLFERTMVVTARLDEGSTRGAHKLDALVELLPGSEALLYRLPGKGSHNGLTRAERLNFNCTACLSIIIAVSFTIDASATDGDIDDHGSRNFLQEAWKLYYPDRTRCSELGSMVPSCGTVTFARFVAPSQSALTSCAYSSDTVANGRCGQMFEM